MSPGRWAPASPTSGRLLVGARRGASCSAPPAASASDSWPSCCRTSPAGVRRSALAPVRRDARPRHGGAPSGCSLGGDSGPARRTWTACGRAPTCRRCCASPRSTARRSRCRPAGGGSRSGCAGPSAHRTRRNTKRGSRRNIEAHYDLGNDFYRLFLDETMTYSSAVFDRRDQSLADAQRTSTRSWPSGPGFGAGSTCSRSGRAGAASRCTRRASSAAVSRRSRSRPHSTSSRRSVSRAPGWPTGSPSSCGTIATSRAPTTRSCRSRCWRPSAPSTTRRSSRPATGRSCPAAG